MTVSDCDSDCEGAMLSEFDRRRVEVRSSFVRSFVCSFVRFLPSLFVVRCSFVAPSLSSVVRGGGGGIIRLPRFWVVTKCSYLRSAVVVVLCLVVVGCRSRGGQ